MSVLVTGANGLIGQRLVRRLAEAGLQVRAMVRNPDSAAAPAHPGITVVAGSMDDPPSLRRVMEGTREVYHLAAFTGVWHRDPGHWDAVNVTGTRHLLEIARSVGVECVVVASTAGVLGPARDRRPVDESSPPPQRHFTAYERSKRRMEEMIAGFDAGGMRVVIVNPTRLFGAGSLNKSNSVTKMLMRYREGTWRLLPGNGLRMGNYAWLDDVVEGLLLAMARGRHAQRYVLGGEDLSYVGLFRRADPVLGVSFRLLPVPLWTMLSAAAAMEGLAAFTGREPLITPGWVRKYQHDWLVSSQKACTELGYRITPYEAALENTFKELIP